MNHYSWLIKRVIPFLCVAILMFCFSTTVSAAESEHITYDSYLEAFENTLSGDALIEEKALVLSELFYQNPAVFLQAVSLEEPDTQNTIIIYLLLANNFGEQPGFMDKLDALNETSNHTAAETYVLQKIYSEMNT